MAYGHWQHGPVDIKEALLELLPEVRRAGRLPAGFSVSDLFLLAKAGRVGPRLGSTPAH